MLDFEEIVKFYGEYQPRNVNGAKNQAQEFVKGDLQETKATYSRSAFIHFSTLRCNRDIKHYNNYVRICSRVNATYIM